MSELKQKSRKELQRDMMQQNGALPAPEACLDCKKYLFSLLKKKKYRTHKSAVVK